MADFTFEAASALLKAAKYLTTFDDTIKFTLTSSATEQTLYLTTANVHPFCYTDYSFQTVTADSPTKRLARESEKVSWAVNSDLLVRVLSCFEPLLDLTLEIEEDASYLLLLQQTPDAAVTRVMRVGVIHELGPSLVVDHGIEELYRISDIDSFRQAARSAAVSDDPSCHICISWEDEDDSSINSAAQSANGMSKGVCFLKLSTSSVKAVFRLGALGRTSSTRLEGEVQCTDLETFGLLCERAPRSNSARQNQNAMQLKPSLKGYQQLCIGFSDSGLSLLRLQWFSSTGETTANLFFCTS